MSASKVADAAIEKPSLPMAIDLADLDTGKASDAGARIEIVHPVSKKGLGIFITVLGKHSQTFREIIKERIDSRIKSEAAAAQKGRPIEPRTADKVEQEAIELLAACTLSWDNNATDKDGKLLEERPWILFRGEQLSFNVPNAMKVYTDILWIREQVDEAIGDLENFIKA